MNTKQLYSAIMAGAVASALAVYSPYVDAAKSSKAKVVTPGAAAKSKGKGKGKVIVSPLEQKLNALDGRVAGLAKDVIEVNAQYNALGARVDELGQNAYIAEDLKEALANKYGELQGLHQTVNEECAKAYAGQVKLAEDVTQAYDNTDRLFDQVVGFGKNAKIANYDKAVEAQKVFSTELGNEENDEGFKGYLSTALTATSDDNPTSVTAQYEKCVVAKEQEVAGVKAFRGLLRTNLLRDEADLRRTIEAIVKENLPEQKASPWSIKALAGAGYFGNGTAHSFPVAVTGELCYAVNPSFSLCANGTVYQNGESKQTETSTPESKTSAVGGSLGYQQQSTLSLQKTTGTDYHNGAGLRLAYNANRNVGFGLSLQAMNGQETVTEDKTRSVVLRNSAGVQLGDASSIADSVTTRRAVHPVVPGVDLTLESAKGFGARLSAGYDLTTGKVMSFIQALYRF